MAPSVRKADGMRSRFGNVWDVARGARGGRGGDQASGGARQATVPMRDGRGARSEGAWREREGPLGTPVGVVRSAATAGECPAVQTTHTWCAPSLWWWAPPTNVTASS